jgi:hypothetical protein
MGWARLEGIAGSPLFVAGERAGDHEDSPLLEAVCGPTPPAYAEDAIPDELLFGYVLGRADAFAKPSPDAPKVGTLENEAVEIIEPASLETGSPEFAKVKLPSGKEGYVAAGALKGFLEEQLCLQQLDGTWRIVGYVGGGD